MRLIDNASNVFKHAWSWKWSVLAVFFSGVEVFLNFFSMNINEPGYIDFFIWHIPVGTFAIFAGLSGMMATITRFIAQEKVSGK